MQQLWGYTLVVLSVELVPSHQQLGHPQHPAFSVAHVGAACVGAHTSIYKHGLTSHLLIVQCAVLVLCRADLCCASGVTHWQSPNYFSWFPGNSSIPGILAEMLITALNMVGFSWQSSPVSTELEMVRIADCLALPGYHTGVHLA